MESKTKQTSILPAILLCLLIGIGCAFCAAVASEERREAGGAAIDHYACRRCGYEFCELAALRVEERQVEGPVRYYHCPSCGALLTSDYHGDAAEQLFDYRRVEIVRR